MFGSKQFDAGFYCDDNVGYVCFLKIFGEIMGYILLFVIIMAVLSGIFAPNKNSTSYRLGRGLGSKTRKLGEWIMDDK